MFFESDFWFGNSQALLVEMVKFGQSIVNLMQDSHPRLLPALIEVLDDFDYPTLQTRAASVIRLFSRNCRADDLKLYLHKIVSKLVRFLQRGLAMMKEAALETLASVAISSQEDSAYIYDSIIPYLKVILETATKDTSRTLLAKSMECITMVTMAFGNQAIHGYVEKVTAVLISLQETQTEIEDPMRKFSLLAYGRLCKCLGEDFLPYLSLAMPIVLKSAQLSVSNSSDTDDSDDESLLETASLPSKVGIRVCAHTIPARSHKWDYTGMIKVTAGNKKIGIRSALLEEKTLVCHILCCFAAELKGRLHLWVNECFSSGKFSVEVRMTAISAMPLLLNSAGSCNRLWQVPSSKAYLTLIIPTLLDALKKILGSRLSKHQAEKFVEGISKVLLTCSYLKTEREKRSKEHTDSREQELLKEEAQQHIGICLGTMVKKLKASFLPLLDKFLPYVSLMWSNDRTAEERRIVVHLFCDVAEQCREEAFRQIVAIAIAICADSDQISLNQHTEGIFGFLKTALEHSFLRKVTGVPKRFKLKELEEATDNFGLLVGRGSSACVFKGVLSDSASVAVKRIDGEERGDKEFKSEVAAIASVQHVDLVRLYCSVPPSGPRFLVYEYIVNGSLDNWIFRKRGIRGCLSLDLRCRVGLDVAKALSYLHHDCRSCILHLDVQPENILLDENHRAILVDFGLSKLMGKVESRVVTMIRGTRGYLAPEWLLENGISEKSDVYSYGMVLLEMIGGRRNITLPENGKSINSKTTGGVAVEMQVKRLACVALSCIQERPSLRSTMARVVEMLEGRGRVEAPRQTTMLILDLLDKGVDHHPGIPRVAAAMARSDTNSLRSYTMSILSGR
ncbi:hypothetical protein H5410_029605 [Solanum commersonii]|uniref:Protein kinase domain-containing protein n=1 Tax=Solanum commersonii TaxID=4109 RepID=A0A9J5YBZ2_SOLCO|nr:hypothetical protein H5410_029605 [Solanum commersonii]